MATPGEEALKRASALIARFPDDARLHFLYGSMLAGLERHIEAHDALARAVALAPDFAIARFQLGLFLLTSGEPTRALETWGRLDALPNGHYLRYFVDGLRALTRDDFASVVQNLRKGIDVNTENPPLSRDMQLILDRCAPLLADDANETTSEAAFILSQSRLRPERPN
jgi:tetratricopeptide (TPR) repeat protein